MIRVSSIQAQSSYIMYNSQTGHFGHGSSTELDINSWQISTKHLRNIAVRMCLITGIHFKQELQPSRGSTGLSPSTRYYADLHFCLKHCFPHTHLYTNSLSINTNTMSHMHTQTHKDTHTHTHTHMPAQ